MDVLPLRKQKSIQWIISNKPVGVKGDTVTVRTQVVIVGAGPTGLTAANLLGKAGIQTLLIERNATLCTHARAIAIDDEGLRICQSIGLSETLHPHLLLNLDAWYVAEKQLLAHVSPTLQANGHPLISTFHQPTLEQLLLQQLQRYSHVEVRFQHTLISFQQDSHNVSLTLHNEQGTAIQVECDYLLACDGGKSTIRRALNITLQPVSPLPRYTSTKQPGPHRHIQAGQQWLVVDGEDDDEISDAIIFHCHPSRPAVTVPAPGRRRRWEFMLLPNDHPDTLLQESTIQTLIQDAGRNIRQLLPTWKASDTLQIKRQAIYTFHASIASSFAQGRVFLLGDAAHLMPPFGGQGMNSGLRDASNLCWKLARVLHQQAEPALLSSYEQERAPHAARMILFSSLLGTTIMPTRRTIAATRNLLFRAINLLPVARNTLSEMRVKPQPRYQRGYFLPHHRFHHDRLSGALIPQFMLQTLDGESILLDEVLGDGFTVLTLYDQHKVHTNSLPLAIPYLKDTAPVPITRVLVLQQGTAQKPLQEEIERYSDQRYVIDSEGTLQQWLQTRKARGAVLRPDHFVLVIF